MKTIESYASVIQRAWRAYCNIRVYRYLRDIILNKLHGLPADLLRSIIPMETDFLDRASGIHVRFRLGGSIFPPKIYYKIYTHRPLCDINAFAPRNYSTERRYQPDPLTLHNKPVSLSSSYPGKYANGAQSSFIRKIQSSIRVGRTFYDATITPPQAEGYDDWYQREDDRNNPWRPISTELEEIISPPPSSILLDKNETRQHNIQKELKRKKKADLTSSPNSAFHYSRLRRQQDILLEKKRRKREWMLKAYTLTAGSKGMVGGNDQEIRPLDGDDNQSRKSDFVPGKDGNIEMCDSFSSRSEMPEQQQHAIRGKTALPLHPTPPIELPHNGEKDQLSHGFKFRYSQTNSQRKDTHQDVEDIGTDDALLKWR